MLTKRFLVNIAFFFCFFPFLKVLPITAETQPIAGIIGLIIILHFGIKRNIFSLTLLWFIFIVLGYYMITSALKPSMLPKITINTVAYFIPLFVFLGLQDKMHLLSVKLYFTILYLWLGLGLLQYFNFVAPLNSLLESILQHLISRYQSDAYGVTRGVAFFSQEPSAGATSIILLLITGVYFYAAGRISRKSMWQAVAASLLMVLLNKSGTGGFMLAIFVFGFFIGYCMAFIRDGKFLLFVRKFVLIPAVITLLVAGFLSLASKYNYRSRFIDSANVMYKAVFIHGKANLYTFAMIGGFRFLTLYVGYASLAENFGLGHGTASWLTDFDRVARAAGVYLEDYPLREEERFLKAVKPNAYTATVAFDMGIIGLVPLVLFFTFFLFSKARTRLPPPIFAAKFGILLTAIAHVVSFGLITLPLPWLLFCYVNYLNGPDVNIRRDIGRK
jgi:hypothetical protein